MEKTVHYEKTLTSEVLFEGRVITLTKRHCSAGKRQDRRSVHTRRPPLETGETDFKLRRSEPLKSQVKYKGNAESPGGKSLADRSRRS